MSLLLSPVLLFLLGLGVARLAKSKRVWRRHSLFALRAGVLALLLYTWLSLSLLLGSPWTEGVVGLLPAEDGTDWMVNSGVFSREAAWPLQDPSTVGLVVLGFMLFPFWLFVGVESGFWLFGRSPKQTGILGLLR